LFILFFNIVGYRFVIDNAENKANELMEEKLDNGKYDAAQLIVIKIAIAQMPPYLEGTTDYVRIDGQIEIAGTEYNYVKYRFNKDTLELLCIPNKEATKLDVAKNDLLKIMNEVQSSSQNKRANPNAAFKNFGFDYIFMNDDFLFEHLHFISSEKIFYLIPSAPFYYPSVIENPPDKYSRV
jgi:hypothetical protein